MSSFLSLSRFWILFILLSYYSLTDCLHAWCSNNSKIFWWCDNPTFMKFIFNKTFWPKHLHSGTCTIKLSCHHCHSKLQKVTILMSKLFHVFNDIAPTSLMTRKFYSISPPSCWYLNSSERLVIGTYCSRVFPKSHNVGMYYSRKSLLR